MEKNIDFRIKNIDKCKGVKLYIKWKVYDISFNSWVNKKKYCYIKCENILMMQQNLT